MSKRFWSSSAGAYVAFLLAILPLQFAWLRHGCLPGYDMAIFSEALQQGWRGAWDPFLHVRESFMLQDHWDPITLILGWITWPLSGFVSAPVFLFWFEATVVFASATYARSALLSRGFDSRRAWLAFTSIIFGAVTWKALHFPVHPATWVLLPYTMLIFWYFDFFQGSRRFELTRYAGLALIIWTCGEQFALALAASHLALTVLAPRRRRDLALMAIPILLGAWWALQGRIVVHGSIYNHSARVSFDPHIVLSKYEFGVRFWRKLLEGLLAYLAPLWLLGIEIKRLARKRLVSLVLEARFLVVALAFASPLLLGRFLAGSWGHQYGVIFGAVFMMGFLVVKDRVFSRRAFAWMLALAMLSTVGDWTKPVRLASNSAPGCDAESGRASSEDFASRLRDLRGAMAEIPQGARVLAGLYLTTTILHERPDLKVHTLGPFSQGPDISDFDYVLVARGELGNQWPLSQDQVRTLLETLPGEKRELRTLTFVKGPISPRFFDAYQGPQSLIYSR